MRSRDITVDFVINFMTEIHQSPVKAKESRYWKLNSSNEDVLKLVKFMNGNFKGVYIDINKIKKLLQIDR